MAHKGGFVEVTFKAGAYDPETDTLYDEETTVMRTDEEAHKLEDAGLLIPKKTTLSSDDVLTRDDFFGNWTGDHW